MLDRARACPSERALPAVCARAVIDTPSDPPSALIRWELIWVQWISAVRSIETEPDLFTDFLSDVMSGQRSSISKYDNKLFIYRLVID